MTGLMRKHGKALLAVFGSLLMVIFVLPNFRNSGNAAQGTYVLGRLNGKKVLARDLYSDAGDLRILQSFRGLYTYLVLAKIPLTPNEKLQPTHWHLLLNEARKSGVTISNAEISDLLAAMKLTDAQLSTILGPVGATERGLRQAIGNALILGKFADLVMNSTTVSLPEVEYLANIGLSKIEIAYATFDGQRDWEKAPAPSEDQIKKQFELYKAVVAPPALISAQEAESLPTPATISGHTYPFGYTYPDRVKVEYLHFDKQQLGTQFKATSEDYDAAYAYYKEHLDEFKTPSDDKLAVSTQPATRPFEQVQKELVSKQVDQRVSKLLQKAAERAWTLANDPWKNVEAPGGFRNLIPPEQWADYQKISAAIAANHEYGGFHPEYHSTIWLGAEQLAGLPGIGGAFLETKPSPIGFPILATHVKDLVGPKDSITSRFFLEVGPENPLLKDTAGDLYMYRVVAAEKSHAPATLDEVRPQVVEDLKKIYTYEHAQADAKELASKAKAGDLLGLAKSRNIPAGTAKDLTQGSSTIPGLGQVPGLVEAAFALSHEPAATQPLQNGQRVSATTTLARDPTLKVYVVELVNSLPTTAEDFNAQRPGLAQEFEQRSRFRFMASWLSLAATENRLHYIPTDASEEKTDEGE